ncbi:hypothetical protein [Litoreibacter arenae]|uniref:Uncharacterized protein n=1 Tax=Litoreibacter arenae DSM 19593 TaxID=1123360 RepID=S9QNG5_9RHOB|nr:hypothetical protein [Litoreibacter arenae]EPX81123.1 hypothetical protein thalar_00571 [Litoreibacter arenae DSM 19593]
MSDKTSPNDPSKPQTAAQLREARLKAALKANMGRRKQQARARKAPADAGNNEKKGQ